MNNPEYKSYGEYKDSGLEWIGDIPKNWNLTKIKYITKEPVSDGPHETPKFIIGNNCIPFLSVDSIKDGELYFDNCRKISKVDHNIYKQKCNPG